MVENILLRTSNESALIFYQRTLNWHISVAAKWQILIKQSIQRFFSPTSGRNSKLKIHLCARPACSSLGNFDWPILYGNSFIFAHCILVFTGFQM